MNTILITMRLETSVSVVSVLFVYLCLCSPRGSELPLQRVFQQHKLSVLQHSAGPIQHE